MALGMTSAKGPLKSADADIVYSADHAGTETAARMAAAANVVLNAIISSFIGLKAPFSITVLTDVGTARVEMQSAAPTSGARGRAARKRSEEHTSELQSL